MIAAKTPVTAGVSPSAMKNRAGQIAVAALLALALVLGGGGNASPPADTVLHCASAAVAALWLARTRFEGMKRVPREAVLLAFLLLLIPAVQLVPLPPSLWHALPGRGSGAETLALIDHADSWQPWTISSGRTLAALLGVVPPVLLVVLVSTLPQRDRWIVTATVAALGLLSLALGFAQMSSPLDGILRFYAPKSPWLQGFEANHNSQADVLSVSIIALAAAAREAVARSWPGRDRALVLFAPLACMLSLGTVLTASRTGMTLLVPALAVTLAILWPQLRLLPRRAPWDLIAAAGLTALCLGAAIAYAPLAEALARFDFAGEKRPEIWHDSLRAVEHFWPFGSGAGTFIPAFALVERAEALYQFPVEHAHNEVLEMLIEGGVLAAIVAALVALVLFRAAVRSLCSVSPAARTSALFAVGAISVVALHSLVDYPLRSMSLACVIGACVGLTIQPRSDLDRFLHAGEEA